MNANYGILQPLEEPVRDKALRKRKLAERALEQISALSAQIEGALS